MSFEKTLLKTIEEYERLLRTGELVAKDSRILTLHQRMKPLRERIDLVEDNPRLVKDYKIVHPNSRIIRNAHSTSIISTDPASGEIDVNYVWEANRVEKVYLFAIDFFFPRDLENGEWWQETHDGRAADYGFSENEFGYTSALRAEGKGTFWSQEVRHLEGADSADLTTRILANQEKETRKIKLQLWQTQTRDEAIRGVVISRMSLEKGDLTAFFNHIDYKLLDDLYSEVN
ncbi:MAG: hypothetical protein WCV90_03780 [Candidatus Woesearchaeota archaeon]